MKKIHIAGLVFTILVFAMVLSLAGCLGQDNNLNETGNENRSDGQYSDDSNSKISDNNKGVKPLPNNYRITKQQFSGDFGSNLTGTMSEMCLEDGFVIRAKASGVSETYSTMFFDFKNNKVYYLDPISKTGLIASGNGETSVGSNFPVVMDTYSNMKNIGHEKVAGWDAVVYEDEVPAQINDQNATVKVKVWISEEYGILLKRQVTGQEAGKNTATISVSEEVTEFKIGGCKLTDMVNLSEYTLTDMTAYT